MIDFSKTEEQELLIESIKELLEREMPAEKERECYRNGEFPWDAWKAMAEAGFTGLGLPEEVGGTDVDLMTVALADFTISRYGGPLAAFYSMGMPTMYDVCEFGTPEQIEKYVKPYIAGGAPLALGISEPSTGSDVAGMQTSYAWDGDAAVINGGKHYTTCGMEAPAIIVIAKDPTVDNVHRGATMFLVDRDTPGVTINKLPQDGPRGRSHQHLRGVPERRARAPLGHPGRGAQRLHADHGEFHPRAHRQRVRRHRHGGQRVRGRLRLRQPA